MTLVWRALCAALLPIALRDLPRALERFLAHLSRCGSRSRERRAVVFYRNLMSELG
jgi:hypothetical protein